MNKCSSTKENESSGWLLRYPFSLILSACDDGGTGGCGCCRAPLFRLTRFELSWPAVCRFNNTGTYV